MSVLFEIITYYFTIILHNNKLYKLQFSLPPTPPPPPLPLSPPPALLLSSLTSDSLSLPHQHRDQFDNLQAASHKYLSDLESLLTLKQFEEAFAEIMSWLSKTHNQLQNPVPITGKPEQVTALLARHKVRIIKHEY